MKYTKSQDGVSRATIRVELRFSEEELAELRRLAKQDGQTSVTKWIREMAPLAWDYYIEERCIAGAYQ